MGKNTTIRNETTEVTEDAGDKSAYENVAFEIELTPTNNNHSSDEDVKTVSKNSEGVNSDTLEDQQCGLGFIRANWIQKYATKKYFMIIYALLGAVQGMTWSYFTATITTLEKRFKMSSKTTGIMMTGNEISQVVFSLILAYYGSRGHRPRWIAVGVLVSALSCFVITSPQIFYGSGDDALSLTEEYASLDEIYSSPSTNLLKNISSLGSRKGKMNLCKRSNHAASLEECNAKDDSAYVIPLVLIFLSQFVGGIGTVVFYTLGGPYLDDNTKRKNVPIVFGITMSLRLVGPTIGYMFAAVVLKIFINPLLTPLIATDDPRWLGAWWLGWTVMGTLMLILAFFISLFPRELRTKNGSTNVVKSSETEAKFSDIPKAVNRLLRNKINLFNTIATLFYIFSAVGYWTYMPKYLETIFMQTASNASAISGLVGILCQATGIMISGFLISKFQPSARKLAAWNVICAFMIVAGNISFTQIGCKVGTISFGQQNLQGNWNLSSSCNLDCNCKVSKILPVCYKEENTVFYSACHAGCTSFENNTISNCSCLPTPESTLTLGNCSEGCMVIFATFLAINAIIKFLDSTGRIGNMLVTYRCVDLKDRSMSIGLTILLVSIFALFPSPIVFGAIIDSVCLVWGGKSHCGKKGNCMLYDGEQLRYLFNLTAAAFTLIGGVFDCLVWYYVKDLELYKQPDPIEKEENEVNGSD